ncbi:MAG: hypothetical protein EU547_07245 [Promethearchaeota archaeon]|nr:MAG: hypothetical protein EU547_07245 [Candidatus Lokiarchaeota archaeon]
MINIHINSHFAIGVIIASLSSYFLKLNFIEYSLIIIASFICDFDVFFSKYAKDKNHRNLISHSIIPSIIIIFIGLFLNWIALIISGFVYFLHVFIDTFDWGTNFFYFSHKTIGLRFLITKEERENLEEHLAKYKTPASFFDFKYYNNKFLLFSELILFVFMLLVVFIFTLDYFYIIFLYFPFLFFHLLRHYKLKKIEEV